MNTLKLQLPKLSTIQNPPKSHFTTHVTPTPMRTKTLTCNSGLRNMGPRKPLWRKSVMSSEAIQTVQALKLAKKTPSKLDHVVDTRLSRLLKVDLLDTLTELQRQNELHLSLKVFEFIKKESWYTVDISIYYDMILLMGKNKLIQKAEELFAELQKDGLQPDTRAYTELIGAYFQSDLVEKAMETYNVMKASGCIPDKLTLMVMVRNLEKAGKDDLVASVKRDFDEYVDDPDEFLIEVEANYARNPLVPHLI